MAHRDGIRGVEGHALGAELPVPSSLTQPAVPASWVRAPVILFRAKTATPSLMSDAT
jgi:hypothetical protein